MATLLGDITFSCGVSSKTSSSISDCGFCGNKCHEEVKIHLHHTKNSLESPQCHHVVCHACWHAEFEKFFLVLALLGISPVARTLSWRSCSVSTFGHVCITCHLFVRLKQLHLLCMKRCLEMSDAAYNVVDILQVGIPMR